MPVRPGDDKSLVGLAGEYHVLAQLAEQGLVGALTLGHTKGVDILVTNPATGAVHQIEVKTTRAKPGRAALFGDGRFFSWPMSVKHEKPLPAGWYFCFVRLEGAGTIPRFFIVPASRVAEYVHWEHQHWLSSRPKAHDNPIRQFRIPESDPDGYENNWAVFK